MRIIKIATTAATLLVGIASTAAQAATVLSASLDGNYTIATPTGSQSTSIKSDGNYAGSLDVPLASSLNPWQILNVTAKLTLNGTDLINNMFDIRADEAAQALQNFIAAAGQVGNPSLGNLGFAGNLSTTPTGGLPANTYAGTYSLDANTTVAPLDVTVNMLLANLKQQLGGTILGLDIPDSLNVPNNTEGTYAVMVNVDVAPVPLPASLPLLGLGVVGLVALRRRKS